MEFSLDELKQIREQIADEIAIFGDNIELERKFEAINVQIDRLIKREVEDE